MNQLTILSLFLIGLSGINTSVVNAEIDFVKEIQPIFKKRCYECHGEETREAGLRLDQKADALAGSDSGQIIKPKDAEGSLLVKLISGEDADRLMPPDGENLTEDEIEKIETWIEEGAIWPDGVDPKVERPKHWAYEPLTVKLPESPALKKHLPIDQLILARLNENKIEPSPIADRYTLIKRLYYDLLGLPPSIAAVDTFVNDKSNNAYEHLVDELLASPHFGERWGRHWLDKARYADSDGYEKDRPRYNAWKYRDWVIEAINSDMPFDQFTIEQLAGDQLENPTISQQLATAFHRQTLTNTEGGTDQEEFRVMAIFDRVETISAVWLGLTMGCARCHSHKYDQISQREYYQLFAFFNNGDETTTKIPSSSDAQKKYTAEKTLFDAKHKELQQPLTARSNELEPAFNAWLTDLQAKHDAAKSQTASNLLESTHVASTGGATLKPLEDGSYFATGKEAIQDVYELHYRHANPKNPEAESHEIAGFRLELLTDDSLPKKGPGRSSGGNFVLSEITVDIIREGDAATRQKFRSATADFSQKEFEVAQAIDGEESTKGWAISPQTGKPHAATFLFEKPLSHKEIFEREVLVRLSQQYSSSIHTLGRFRIEWISTAQAELIALPENIKTILAIETVKRDKKQTDALMNYYRSQDKQYRELKSVVDALQKEAPFNPEMVVRVIKSRTDSPRETHIMKRGDFLQPQGPVQPGTLEVLTNSLDGKEETQTRLDFANWLVSGKNPLPPRVFVNQVWSHLFGVGLVPTLNDFGVRGDAVSHPLLLDWLANHFIESGWSRKKLIKTIAMSAAYQRSSAHRSELADVDPTNKLLYRQNRFRAEAEIVRDLYLAASGLLEPRIGGPSVFPPLPAGIANVSYANNFKWGNSDWNSRPDRPSGVSPKEDIYRRGMYTFFKRTAAHPNLVTFDCPDSNTTCVNRGSSNTPLQALQTLNNNVFVDASRAMADLLLNSDHLKTDDQRLQELFRRCTGRPPTNVELKILQKLLHDADAYYTASPKDAIALAKNEKQDEATTKATWVAVSRTVLNLDEFITRE